MSINIEKVFFSLGSVILFLLILYFGKNVLAPIATGTLAAFILYPLGSKLESFHINRRWSTVLSMAIVTIVLFTIAAFFSSQILDITSEADKFVSKLMDLGNELIAFLNNRIKFIPMINGRNFFDNMKQYLTESGIVVVSDTLNITGLFLSWSVLVFIYTFLILLYRRQILLGVGGFIPTEHLADFRQMVADIQRVGQQYVGGMIILMLILGTLNSLALLIIGLDFPFFFGFLAAVLTVIPYVGTFLGALFPTVYAFSNYPGYWMPVAVIAVFWAVQTLEGNYLTPKIIGGKMDLNAFTSITALILGFSIWGIIGMVLFLPFIAMFKVVCKYFPDLEPIGHLMAAEDTGPSLSFSKLLRKVAAKLRKKS